MRKIVDKLCLLLLLLTVSVSAAAQEISVSGSVSEAGSGEMLSGVRVMVEGTSQGAATNIDGKFSIQVPSENSVLVFSYVGMKSQKIEVGTKTVIDVVLGSDVVGLEQLIVVGFGTQKKESVIGSIATLDSKALLRSPAANLTQAISGRIPGLVTSQGQGQPGYDEAKIFIRGRGSFAGDGQPLILVDGVERSFSQISANDVAQISVLKDASATAVFGVRGANGVILVTTKRGTEGSHEVSFSANYSIQSPTRTPKYLNSYNSVVLLEEALSNDGAKSQYSANDVEMFRKSVTGQLSGDDRYRYPNVDWYDEVLREYAPAQDYNLNISGGTKRMRYFASGGYFDQRGLYKPKNSDEYGQSSNARFQRYSFRANLDFLLTRDFTMSVNFGTRFEDRKGPNVSEAANQNEVFTELNRTPSWVFPVQWPDGRYGGNAFAKNNIVGRLSQGGFYSKIGNTNETNVIVDHKLDFVTQGLSVRAMGSFDYYTDYDHRFTKNFATYELINRDGDLYDPANYSKYNEDGRLTEATSPEFTRLSTHLEAGLNYARTFDKKHNVGGLILYTQDNSRWQADIAKRYQGIVGRATYDYDLTYFAEVNLGYNGSENFSKGRRFGFFPSFSAGWMISNEPFLKSKSWLDMLKLRASYGEVGNDNFKIANVDVRFLYLSRWQQGGGYTFGDNSAMQGVFEGMMPNQYVTWERAQKYNFALEGALRKSILGFTFDVFYEKRANILTEYLSKPLYLAVPLAPANLGRTTNQGFELEVYHRHSIGQVNYNVRATMALSKNKIDFMDEPAAMPGYMKSQGGAIGQFRGLIVDGFITAADLANPQMPVSAYTKTLSVGDLKYRDMNHDGRIDDLDITAIGQSDIPEQTFSLSMGADWNGFGLNVMFQGVNNVSRFYGAEAMFAFLNGGKVRDFHMDRWDPSKSEEYNLANAKYPLLHYASQGDHNQRVNSYFLDDASFIRLKNVELSYTLPQRWAQKLYTSDIRVYVNGNNLATWDKLGGRVDPESTGANVYPIMKVFNMGVNIKF